MTQKVIEGGGMGFFRRKNGEVGVLVRFDDAHWREKIACFLFWYCKRRVNPHAANKNQHGDRIFFLEKVENVKLNKSFSKSMFFFDPFIHEKIQAKEVVRLDAFCRCDSAELDTCSIPKKNKSIAKTICTVLKMYYFK